MNIERIAVKLTSLPTLEALSSSLFPKSVSAEASALSLNIQVTELMEGELSIWRSPKEGEKISTVALNITKVERIGSTYYMTAKVAAGMFRDYCASGSVHITDLLAPLENAFTLTKPHELQDSLL